MNKGIIRNGPFEGMPIKGKGMSYSIGGIYIDLDPKGFKPCALGRVTWDQNYEDWVWEDRDPLSIELPLT